MESSSYQQEIIDKHEFLGSITNGKETVENLHIMLQYPLTSQGKITGRIVGTKEIFDKVYKLFKDSSGIFSFQLNCIYQTKDNDQFSLSIKSQSVRIQPIGKSHEEAKLPSLQGAMMLELDQFMNNSTMAYDVAEIECENLEIVTIHPPVEELLTRRLTFFLAGASKMWLRDPIKAEISSFPEFSSFTGVLKPAFNEFTIDLSHLFPYEIKVLPRFFRQKRNGETIILSVPVLQIITEEAEQTLSDDQFIAAGITIVNNVELLTSFIYKRWTTWHLYELQTNKSEIIYKRVARECLTELDKFGPLVPNHKVENFLKTGYTNLRNLQEKGLNLLTPIAYFIAGHEARHLEEQFAITFLSLEKLKDLFAAQENCQLNLAKEAFNKFRKKSKLSNLIEEIVSEILHMREETEENIDTAVQNIKAKIPDLNHPPLRGVLENLLSTYQIDWKELYPLSQEKLSIINTRDRLFHTSEEREGMFFLKETDRLQALVGRLLLRMLGWDDLSFCPRQDILNSLIEENDR